MITLTDQEFDLLISLLPEWSLRVPLGMSPMSYGTGTYSGDLKICEQVEAILDKRPTTNSKSGG